MKISRSILFLLILLLPALAYAGWLDNVVDKVKKKGQEAYEGAVKPATDSKDEATTTEPAADPIAQPAATGSASASSSASAGHTSLEAISAFTVDGLSLDTPYREMHEALIADGHTIISAIKSLEQIEASPRSNTRFDKRSNDGSRWTIDISLANGHVWRIQYNLTYPSSFNVPAAVADAKKQLGEPTGPCELSGLKKNCRWQNAPDDEYTGGVNYASRELESSNAVHSVHYRIYREDIKTAALEVEKAIAESKKPKPIVVPVIKEKAKLVFDPYTRAKRGETFGPDVVGLQLGMTLDEADQMIKERKKPREVIDGEPLRPFVRARLYLMEPADEAIALFTLKDEHGERVAGLIRKVYFEPGSAPSQAAIVSSLDEKYGSPAYKFENRGSSTRLWLSTADGHHVNEAGAETRACEYPLSDLNSRVWTINGELHQWELARPKRAWASLNALEIASGHRGLDQVSRCGPTLRANYGDNAGQLTGPSLQTTLFDAAWIIATEEAMNDADRAQGAKGLDL